MCCNRPILSITMNISEEEIFSLGSYQDNIMFSIFYALIFIIAVPGNALALWTFCHEGSTSPSVIFLKHLSLADIFYILILPMRIIYHVTDSHWPFGYIACKLAGFLFYLNMYCSIYIMSFISVDRFLAVVLPIKSQSVRKAMYANVAVSILWVIVIVSMFPTLLSKKDVSTNSTYICQTLYLEGASSTALVSTVVAFTIPLSTTVVSYILILWKLRTVKQQPIKDKAKKIIILVMMNFLFAFVPYHVNRVIYIQSHSRGHMTAESYVSLRKANQITSALTCVSGVLDPVMCFFVNCAYREKLLQLCKVSG